MESLAAYSFNYLKPYTADQNTTITEVMNLIYEKGLKLSIN